MIRFRRRATMLTEAMVILPLLAGVSIVAFEVTNRSLRFQARECRIM